ncbi:hypothetical protein PSACC_01060 [Paramicrosporidium saccamoebae]|uniref:Uncharacterized protein n=1 Tax=Paramicrosporidium saccamoebae TaxID=1246581 RepID=A0A2H9TN18_9FUNG|nr:hypothetical protein PSACC_01060 [Paramicrosporidium saccamoebae]
MCLIPMESQAVEMDTVDVIKESLREGYDKILLCAQSKAFAGWKNSGDYHWFYALSMGKGWFKEELWDWAAFDWEANFDAILRADNPSFFQHALDQKLAPTSLNAETLPSQGLLEHQHYAAAARKRG